MLQEQNYVNYFRREVLSRVAAAFLRGDDIAGDVERIRFDMAPKTARSVRCCIYKDRAILRYRGMAALGFLLEDEQDESTPMSHYVDEALRRETPRSDPFILSTCDIACHGCVPARFFVTNACQGCLAKPCVSACRFDAIRIVNGRSQIDTEKCRNCTMCQKACPYEAIVQINVPCEKSCPVDAIKKGEDGRAYIDFDRCISCGRCMRACPFGAVLERSQIVDVIRLFKHKKHTTALVAPALAGQFNATMGQLFAALKQLGFDEVLEVATGADMTSRHEAAEFVERMEQGQPFMTTSCCPAYIQSVEKILPEVTPFVSDTPTPMHYTAALARRNFPGTLPVFIGPCVAKRVEGMRDEDVHAVLTFEELGALFAAALITPTDLPEENIASDASPEGRMYAITGGVAGAVRHQIEHGTGEHDGGRVEIRPVEINGLSRAGLKQLKGFATGSCPGNLVEVMACEGGCVGGSGVLGVPAKAARAVEKFARTEKEKAEKEQNAVPLG